MTVPLTDAPSVGAVIATMEGVGVEAGVGVAVAVTTAGSTITPMLAEPIVAPLLLYPRQSKVCEPAATELVFHAVEKVNPVEFE